MRRLHFCAALAAFLFSCAVLANTFGVASAGLRPSKTKIQSSYPDTASGLKQLLRDMRDVARKGKSDALKQRVKDLEIPDDRSWFATTFGTEGSHMSDSYEKKLNNEEDDFEDQMVRFAREDGYFSAKKQDPAKVYQNFQGPLEVFLASWSRSPTETGGDTETPIAYFLFIDGKFRWDSTIVWIELD